MPKVEKQPTCAERIGPELESTLNTLRPLLRAYFGEPQPCRECQNCDTAIDPEDFESLAENCECPVTEEALNEHGLGFDYVARGTFEGQEEGYFRYQLSWGGPSDEFRFYTEGPHFEPYRIEYWFMDWFDGASRTLYGSDLDFMVELWNGFLEVGAAHEFERAQED